MRKEVAAKKPEEEVLPDWKAAMELADLDIVDSASLRYLSETAEISRTFAWELLGGRAVPNRSQAERVVRACEPLIQARKARGEIKDVGNPET